MDDEMTPIDNDEMMDLFGDDDVTEIATEVPEIMEVAEETPMEEDLMEAQLHQ